MKNPSAYSRRDGWAAVQELNLYQNPEYAKVHPT
jgi:hypothetical protein